jgi:undecaprenyl-diphosphatase
MDREFRRRTLMFATSLGLACLGAALWMTHGVLVGHLRVERFDTAVVDWFQNHRSPQWDETMLELTALGGDTVLVTFVLFAVGLLSSVGHLRRALFVLLCASGALIVTFAAKDLVDRPRPEVAEPIIQPESESFPSGHAFMSMTVYLLFAWFVSPVVPRRSGQIYIVVTAVALSIAIGISRLYLGVHYPTDVLAGWSAGLAWVIAWWLLLQLSLRLRQRIRTTSERSQADLAVVESADR